MKLRKIWTKRTISMKFFVVSILPLEPLVDEVDETNYHFLKVDWSLDNRSNYSSTFQKIQLKWGLNFDKEIIEWVEEELKAKVDEFWC